MSEENIVQNTETESPISPNPKTQQETVEGATSAAAPQEQETTDDTTATSGDSSSAATEETEAVTAPFITVKYNHEDRSFSQQEAEQLVRHGLYYDGLYNKLDYIAAQKDTSVDALIDGIMQSMEDAKRAELQSRFGDDEGMINDLMTLYHNSQKEKYEKAVADRKAADMAAENESREKLEQRLAREYSELKKEFPDVVDFTALPDGVKREAAAGRNLISAYLLHQHRENAKIQANLEAEANAAKGSAGSMATDGVSDSMADAVISGIWSK